MSFEALSKPIPAAFIAPYLPLYFSRRSFMNTSIALVYTAIRPSTLNIYALLSRFHSVFLETVPLNPVLDL